MAALAANTVVNQTLIDSSNSAQVKLLMFQFTAGDESSVLKVNAETLVGRTFVLTVNPNRGYKPGEQLTGSVSNATAFVTGIDTGVANTIEVVNMTGNTAFSVGDVLTGTIAPLAPTTNVTAVTIPTRELDIDGVSWSVAANACIGVEFANSSVFQTVLLLSGTGYMGKNDFQVELKPSVISPDGNIYISTYGIPAKGGYNLILKLNKTAGYSQRPGY